MTTQSPTKWEGLDFEELQALCRAELRAAFDPKQSLAYCDAGHPIVGWNVQRRRRAPSVCLICLRRGIVNEKPRACNAGHEIRGANVYVHHGRVYCKICHVADAKRWNEKRKATRAARLAGEDIPAHRKISHEELLAHRREQAARRRTKTVALHQTLREERLRAASDPS